MTKSVVRRCVAALALLCSSLYTVLSFSQVKIICNNVHGEQAYQPCREGSVRCNLVENSLLTLTAGALAGSIGVGVAYPLDALKTKAQTYASSRDSSSGAIVNCDANLRGWKLVLAKLNFNSRTFYAAPLGLVGMTKLVLKEEGISGFYGGVTGVMIGQGNLCHASMFWPISSFSLYFHMFKFL